MKVRALPGGLPRPRDPAYHAGVRTLLSDLVTCPRCGPSYGLVLMPMEVRDRWVATGVLGCANCREQYEIRDGVTDLRVAGDPPWRGWQESAGRSEVGVEEALVRLAALLGLGEASGVVVLGGEAAAHGPALAGLVEGIEVVVLAPEPGAARASGGVSPFLVGDRIPLRDGAAAAVCLTGPAVRLADEAIRVLRPGGRLLLEPVTAAIRSRMAEAPVSTTLDEGGALVVTRRG